MNNIVPFISGEEPKMEMEAAKILGSLDNVKTKIREVTEMKISASCNRVPVIEGHTESVFIEFAKRPAPSVAEVKDAFKDYVCEAQRMKCFSAPEQCITVTEQSDRPQPRLDALVEKGNGIVVGRVRECNVFDVKFTLLVHNTILGAASSSIMNAEIALSKGLIK
jgi:aspartate-semialdehyde dehydrogenase